MIRPPPRSTLFPHPTLSRSLRGAGEHARREHTEGDVGAVLPMVGQRRERVVRGGRPMREGGRPDRSEEHTSELQSPCNLVCRLLLEKKKNNAARRRHRAGIP